MKTSINSRHHQYSDWLREFQFYKDELAIFGKRLAEVASGNTGKDVLAQLEHFQNVFVILNEQLDTLKHEVTVSHQKLLSLAQSKPEHIDEKFLPETSGFHDRIAEYSLQLAKQKQQFNSWLSKLM